MILNLCRNKTRTEIVKFIVISSTIARLFGSLKMNDFKDESTIVLSDNDDNNKLDKDEGIIILSDDDDNDDNLRKPFKFHSSGNICYFNSLMQSLLSLSDFYKLSDLASPNDESDEKDMEIIDSEFFFDNKSYKKDIKYKSLDLSDNSNSEFFEDFSIKSHNNNIMLMDEFSNTNKSNSIKNNNCLFNSDFLESNDDLNQKFWEIVDNTSSIDEENLNPDFLKYFDSTNSNDKENVDKENVDKKIVDKKIVDKENVDKEIVNKENVDITSSNDKDIKNSNNENFLINLYNFIRDIKKKKILESSFIEDFIFNNNLTTSKREDKCYEDAEEVLSRFLELLYSYDKEIVKKFYIKTSPNNELSNIMIISEICDDFNSILDISKEQYDSYLESGSESKVVTEENTSNSSDSKKLVSVSDFIIWKFEINKRNLFSYEIFKDPNNVVFKVNQEKKKYVLKSMILYSLFNSKYSDFNFGHYITLTNLDDCWYICDDSRYYRVDYQKIFKNNNMIIYKKIRFFVYLLFFEKKTE